MSQWGKSNFVSLSFFVTELRGSTAECPLKHKSPNDKCYTIHDVSTYCADKKLIWII